MWTRLGSDKVSVPAKITAMYRGLLYRLHGALNHTFPELRRKMPCCFSCAVLISVLRNLATLRGAEFHVWASLATRLPPGPPLVCFAIVREGTLANSEPRGSGSPWTGFMYRTRAIVRTACNMWKCQVLVVNFHR